MKSVVLRLLARERGLFAGAMVVAAACAALGVPVDFVLFGLTLAGVGLFHHHAMQVALSGLTVIVLYKLGFMGFKTGPGFGGFLLHLAGEWVVLANLFGLLLGFALLSNHFEQSKIPALLPNLLPDDWTGGFVLLLMIFVLSDRRDRIPMALTPQRLPEVLSRAEVAAVLAAPMSIKARTLLMTAYATGLLARCQIKLVTSMVALRPAA